MNHELVGLAAGLFTTICLVPQLYRVFKLKSAREISLLFTVLLSIGNILWLSYGLVSGLPSVILWNAISFVLVVGLIAAKLRYGQ